MNGNPVITAASQLSKEVPRDTNLNPCPWHRLRLHNQINYLLRKWCCCEKFQWVCLCICNDIGGLDFDDKKCYDDHHHINYDGNDDADNNGKNVDGNHDDSKYEDYNDDNDTDGHVNNNSDDNNNNSSTDFFFNGIDHNDHI